MFAADVSARQFDVDNIEVVEARWCNSQILPPKKSHLLKAFLKLEAESKMTPAETPQ